MLYHAHGHDNWDIQKLTSFSLFINAVILLIKKKKKGSQASESPGMDKTIVLFFTFLKYIALWRSPHRHLAGEKITW